MMNNKFYAIFDVESDRIHLSLTDRLWENVQNEVVFMLVQCIIILVSW